MAEIVNPCELMRWKGSRCCQLVKQFDCSVKIILSGQTFPMGSIFFIKEPELGDVAGTRDNFPSNVLKPSGEPSVDCKLLFRSHCFNPFFQGTPVHQDLFVMYGCIWCWMCTRFAATLLETPLTQPFWCI